jgi:CPA1 family monovalent cation:H+ antiporter
MAIESTLREVEIETSLKQFLLVLSVSLSVATLPQMINWLHKIPYTLLLVIVGLGLAFFDVRLVHLSPELILLIFLPPLVFEAAWNLQWSLLKQDFIRICLFAIVGVLISIVGTTLGLNQWMGISLPTALLIGASLSATDPVSVVALFRELGVDKRLSTLMEGESLFNDGMAIVAFSFLLSFALGKEQLQAQPILAEFLMVVGIGIGLGTVIGFGISYLTQRFDLPLVEQSLTLVSAYGTYLVAESLGGSGVIAVVTVGLILGNFGSRIGMSPRTRVIVTEFWDFLSFFVNSIVFLLIGDQIHFDVLGKNLATIVATVVLMVITRAISIYGLGFLGNRITSPSVSPAEHTVLWWGGLRGSVSIALALSIPAAFGDREGIIATVFGVVLFTLLVQGITIPLLLKGLRLLGDQPVRQQYAERVAQRAALSRVLQYLEEEEQRPGVKPEFYHQQEALIKTEIERLQTEIDQLQNKYPNLGRFMTEQIQQELLGVEADTYAEFVRTGRLNRELAPLLEKILATDNHAH